MVKYIVQECFFHPCRNVATFSQDHLVIESTYLLFCFLAQELAIDEFHEDIRDPHNLFPPNVESVVFDLEVL